MHGSVQLELENGIYFIRVIGNEHFFTQKLIITKQKTITWHFY